MGSYIKKQGGWLLLSLLLHMLAAGLIYLWPARQVQQVKDASAPVELAVSMTQESTMAAEPAVVPMPAEPVLAAENRSGGQSLPGKAAVTATVGSGTNAGVVADSASNREAIGLGMSDKPVWGGEISEHAAKTDHPPRVMDAPDPVYPETARRRHWSGSVVVLLLVNREGSVVQVQVESTSGHDILDRAAATGVRDWRFEPACRQGQAVEEWVQKTVTFSL